MNLSGNAVRYWMKEEEVPLERLLVIVDEIALPFGTLRLKGKGSAGGHNGLKHIEATLGTSAYARLRFGIGSDYPKGSQIDYVLGTDVYKRQLLCSSFFYKFHIRLSIDQFLVSKCIHTL